MVVIAGVSGALYLLATRRKDVEGINQKSMEALKTAVAARDISLADAVKKLGEAQSDLEEMTTEYTALAGIDIKELLLFAEKGYQAELKALKNDVQALEDQLARAERLLRIHEGSHEKR